MTSIDYLVMIIVGIVLAVILMKYLWWSATADLRRYEQLESDPEYRKDRLAEIKTSLEEAGFNAELYREMAHIYIFNEDFSSAVETFNKYLEKDGKDIEGYAELADCYINLEDGKSAVKAIATALEKNSNCADYYAIMLRASLLSGNIDSAESAYNSWQDLDQLRIKRGGRPHRWSIFYQAPRAPLVPDPALGLYRAAIFCAQGRHSEAKELITSLWQDYPGFMEDVLPSDIVLKEVRRLHDA